MTSDYDLIVIGAGINGAAIAREAALGGLAVLVLDKSDIGGGTTSASTRLIHGGLRYLEHAEFGLVRESLREREALLELASHLVEPLGLCLPLYSGARRGRWQVRFGMWLYDLLSFGKSLPKHRMLSREEMRDRLPGLDDRGLVGGAYYFDAQIRFPERLVVENVLDASQHGATIMNYSPVTGLMIEEGRVRGVEWLDRHSRAGRATAPFVVNATGPWIDSVVGEGSPRLIGGTKGSHIVVEPFPGAPRDALYTEAASDGRPFFIIPWNGMYLIGTTDVRYEGEPGAAQISDEEFTYLVAEAERLFPSAGGLAPRVLYTQAGIRPLPYRPGAVEGAITRRHLIHVHDDARGLYSVIGGKLTTHRSLAAQVIERLRRDGAPLARAESSRDEPLPGAADAHRRDAIREELGRQFGGGQVDRLWHTYGRLCEHLLAATLARPELAVPVDANSGLLRVELVYALESEWAETLIDLLHRRCMVGLGPDFGLNSAQPAAEALYELGFWNRARTTQELHAYFDFASRSRAKRAARSASSIG